MHGNAVFFPDQIGSPEKIAPDYTLTNWYLRPRQLKGFRKSPRDDVIRVIDEMAEWLSNGSVERGFTVANLTILLKSRSLPISKSIYHSSNPLHCFEAKLCNIQGSFLLVQNGKFGTASVKHHHFIHPSRLNYFLFPNRHRIEVYPQFSLELCCAETFLNRGLYCSRSSRSLQSGTQN